MRGATFTVETTLVVEVCCNASCGVTFGLEANHAHELRRTHAWFYCPNGHSQHYTAKSDAELLADEKLRTERLRTILDDERSQHRRTERRLIATRGVVTRTKKRIAAGLCPKCHEAFPALAEHIKAEHPDYDPEAEIAALVKEA